MMKVSAHPTGRERSVLDVRKLDLDSPEQPVERIQVEQPLGLATTRYQNWRESNGYLPVGVTVGKPRFVRYDYIPLKVLAPFELMQGPLKGIDDIPLERRVYRERLRWYEHEILAALQGIAEEFPGSPAALMCFEDVNGGSACHRQWAAEWFGERFGWEVLELPNPADMAPRRPKVRKPQAPEPPTLF